jgi:RNA polymerase primary sigma factor
VNDVHPFVDDPIKAYLAEVAKVPPLSRDEESGCVRHIRAGGQQAEFAAKRLLEANLHLVVSIAERFRDDRNHFLDLVQKGNGGLLEAVLAFKDVHQASFPAHATVCIERAIADAIVE